MQGICWTATPGPPYPLQIHLGSGRPEGRVAISNAQLEDLAYELNRRAAIAVPLDAMQAFRAAAARETQPLARYVLDSVVQNAELAVIDQRPMCGDTGLPRFYVKAGNEARLQGGFVG